MSISGTCFCTMLQEYWISDALVPMIQAEIVHVPQDEMLNESAADGGTHCSGYVSVKRGALVLSESVPLGSRSCASTPQASHNSLLRSTGTTTTWQGDMRTVVSQLQPLWAKSTMLMGTSGMTCRLVRCGVAGSSLEFPLSWPLLEGQLGTASPPRGTAAFRRTHAAVSTFHPLKAKAELQQRGLGDGSRAASCC